MRPSLTVATLMAGALALPLAACSKQPEVSATNASTTEVQQKVAAATGGAPIEPGRWESEVTVRDMDMNMPNLPPQAQAQVKEQMKARMNVAHGYVKCITPEDVQRAFLTGPAGDKNCKYDHFTLAGGKIDAAATCSSGPQSQMSMAMTGTYSPEAYHMDMDLKVEGGGPVGAMTMKTSVDSKRVGACKGTPDEK